MNQTPEVKTITRATLLSIIRDHNKMIKEHYESISKLEKLLDDYPIVEKAERYKHRPADDIIKIVNEVFGTNCQELSRRRRVVDARHCAVFMLRQYTDLSFKEVGEQLGTYADHSTAISSLHKCNQLIDIDEVFRSKVEVCKDMIENKFKIK